MAEPTVRWRSDLLARTVAQLEAEMRTAWAGLLRDYSVRPGSPEEAELAWLVADDPAEHDWRTVDAAIDQLTCPDCGSVLASGPAGPAGCGRCDYHHRLRFGAREVDRPDVPPGNEHALRVATAVARARERYSPRARVGYELVLPDLLAGGLPTTAQAQAGKALINKLTNEECDRVVSLAEVERLVRGRSSRG